MHFKLIVLPRNMCLKLELFIRFTASDFRKLLSIYVFSYFSFGFEGRMWDLIVSAPDHCLSFYFLNPSSFELFQKYGSYVALSSMALV